MVDDEQWAPHALHYSPTTIRRIIDVWAGTPMRMACSAAASLASTSVSSLLSAPLGLSLHGLPPASDGGASSSPLSVADSVGSGSPAAAFAARSCHHLHVSAMSIGSATLPS